MLTKNRRGDKIRTCDLCVPNAALYQTEPRLDMIRLEANESYNNTFWQNLQVENERKIKKSNQLEESRLEKVSFSLLLRALPALFKWNQKFGDSG